MPDLHTAACLEKNWPVLAGLLGLVQRLLNAPLFTHGLKRRAYGLLRLAESLARRLLVLRAVSLVLPALRVRPHDTAHPQTARDQAPRQPAIRLVEALPGFPGPDDIAAHPTAPSLPEADDTPANPAPALARLTALQDMIDRPDHHARRMARFLKRLYARTGRLHPFRLRRPPGCKRRPDDPLLDQQLRDADVFARRALQPAPG
ncbi:MULTISPECIES: hypothetical protein [Henriciella]|uniref:hypothetical protein n=1 Tax=Henriciella TaxID=453849 RepID=UPI0035117B8F